MEPTPGNLGPRQRRRRLVTGIVMLVAGGVLLVALALAGAGRGWRLLALLPFWVGALGIFQARAAT